MPRQQSAWPARFGSCPPLSGRRAPRVKSGPLAASNPAPADSKTRSRFYRVCFCRFVRLGVKRARKEFELGMNTKFYNNAKTALLLGLLTGGILAIGSIWGQQGLIIAMVFAAVTNVVGYFFSDKIALAT